jgi:hypothetical protein
MRSKGTCDFSSNWSMAKRTSGPAGLPGEMPTVGWETIQPESACSAPVAKGNAKHKASANQLAIQQYVRLGRRRGARAWSVRRSAEERRIVLRSIIGMAAFLLSYRRKRRSRGLAASDATQSPVKVVSGRCWLKFKPRDEFVRLQRRAE